ncbi:MAG: hypothetical protein ACXVX3_11820 [Blastococcus sp.]
MLIDCDTCTVRGTGCADCVVTVLLGAPPGWQTADPVVLPMPARLRSGPPAHGGAAGRADDAFAEDAVVPPPGIVVEFDEVERRAVRALAEGGLVPPLRHRGTTDGGPDGAARHGRRTG